MFKKYLERYFIALVFLIANAGVKDLNIHLVGSG